MMVFRSAAALFLVACAGANRATSVCGDGGICEAQLSREQALLQMRGQLDAQVKEGEKAASSQCGSVQRRRRHETMRACRRRHSRPGLWDSDKASDQWKCNEATHEMECHDTRGNSPIGGSFGNTGGLVGYPSTGAKKARGLWCEVDIPPADWTLKSCPSSGSTTVKVLSYNLFWWNLFKRHGGSERSAGRLIARTAGDEHYDFMGFQECDDRWRVLRDAGMAGDYEALDGGRAIAIAYRKSRWTLLAHDSVDVGEDSHDQYYGKRSAIWGRFQNSEGKKVFFMNHHGPLKVSQGGGCTGSATAMNLLRVIGQNAHADDVIILVGDFNAQPSSSRIRELEQHLTRVFSGHSMGGVDHVFSNCGGNMEGRILGKGDGRYKSDHDAVSVKFTV